MTTQLGKNRDRLGASRPATVLITELGTGAFVVQGYPTGVAAYVSGIDSQALRQVLDAAFSESGFLMHIPPILASRI